MRRYVYVFLWSPMECSRQPPSTTLPKRVTHGQINVYRVRDKAKTAPLAAILLSKGLMVKGGPLAPASSMAAISSSVKGTAAHKDIGDGTRSGSWTLTNIGDVEILLQTLFT